MTVTAKEIKELRDKTGVGMADCKDALNNSNGDMNQAIIYLRKKGIGVAGKSQKVAKDGTIGYYIHTGSKIGVMVEVGCETDFAANTEDIQQLAKDIAMHVTATNPQWLAKNDVPKEIIDREIDIMADSIKGKPANIAEKIIEGKLNKFFKEVCLLEQVFVKDNNLTINELLTEATNKIREKIVIKRFVRFVVGE